MILTRSTPLSQPTGRPVVDLSNPITRGLIAASNGINGTHGINLSVVPTGVNNSGLVLKSPGGKGYLIPLIASVTSSEWTLVSKYSISTSAYQAGIGVYGSSSEFISQMPMVFPFNKLGCDANPYARDNASASELQLNKEYALASVISASRNTIEHYIDGVLVGSSSLSSTSAITVNSVEVFVKNLTTDYAAAGATVGAFAVFNRALTSDEVRSLSLNPWQLFRPVQRRTYFDMGAGGGVTIHNVTAAPAKLGSTVARPGLTQTHITTARPVTQGATVTRPAITQTHVVTARAVAQGGTVNAPSTIQAHIVTARTASQGGAVTRPGLTQTHTVTARAVTQGAAVNAPPVDVGSTPATFVTARPVAQGSTVSAPSIRQTHVTSARAAVQGSTINAPGLGQMHMVTARAVVQASAVRVAGIAPPFVRSIYWASVPSEKFSAAVPAERFKAAVPSEKFSAAVPRGNQ